jgi:hypothetical protein
MRKVAFTLCSNNYLGAAKVLIESLRIFHPELELFIGLVDEQSKEIDYGSFPCTIIPANTIGISRFEELCSRFNIVELNTTVKPFYFQYFFNKGAKHVIYLDPDIEVYSPLTEVIKGMETAMITITPHMLTPIDDEFGPNDYHILRTGVFNLGFIALSKREQLTSFLKWWAKRCIKYGFRKDELGMFYDQIWINYVPAFFDSYYIIRHPGYNAANWNLHERSFSKDEAGKWRVNKTHELAFFHFSHFNILKPDIMSAYNSRFDFTNRKDVAPLFRAYYEKVVAGRGIEYKKIEPYYKPLFEKAEHERIKEYYTFKRKLINKITQLIQRYIPG